jgi:GT2 family glycosyltransferase
MNICAVVLDHRGAHRTEACLLSLASEGLHTVLVVDNSADAKASEQLADSIARVISSKTNYALHVLKPGSNLGFAGGVNFALNHQAGQDCEAILLLNNDASIAPGSISKMSDALAAGLAALIAPTIMNDQGAIQPMMWYQRFFGLQTDHPLPGAFPYLSGCCILFRRSLHDSRKLFDEDFFMYGEDTLLGWEMARKRKPILQIADAVVRHTGQDPEQKCTLFYEYHMTRAHILLALKTRRTVLEIPVLLVAKSAALFVRALRRCIRYRSSIPLLAFALAWSPVNIRKV